MIRRRHAYDSSAGDAPDRHDDQGQERHERADAQEHHDPAPAHHSIHHAVHHVFHSDKLTTPVSIACNYNAAAA